VRRALAVALLLPGCAVFQAIFNATFEKPRLTFKTARLTDVTLTAVTLETVWELENPNDVGVTLARADCHVFVEDQPVATGAPPPGFAMPAHGRTALVFPARVKLHDVLPAAWAVAGKDTARYRIEGTAGIDTPIGVLDFPLAFSGDIEPPRLPAMRFLAPNVSARGIELPLELTNRNSFALPLAGLSGTVRVGGQELGTVSTGNLGTLAPKETRVVRMPLSLNVLQAASGLEAMLRGDKVPVTFNAELISGGERIPIDLNQVLEGSTTR
jgi:LEA14-like dessication related protein